MNVMNVWRHRDVVLIFCCVTNTCEWILEIYENHMCALTAVKKWDISGPRSYEHCWTSSWKETWKYSGPYGIWTHDLCDTGVQIPYGPEFFSGPISTTSSVVFIAARIAYISHVNENADSRYVTLGDTQSNCHTRTSSRSVVFLVHAPVSLLIHLTVKCYAS